MLNVSVNDSCCYQHELSLIFFLFLSARSLMLSPLRLPRETGVRVLGLSEGGPALTVSFTGQHLPCQGLHHTVATSCSEVVVLTPGQSRLKLPLAPGHPPPPQLDLEPGQNSQPIQGQFWAEHRTAPTSPLLDDDVHVRTSGPLPAARSRERAISSQVMAASVCPSPQSLPHIVTVCVRNTAPVL